MWDDANSPGRRLARALLVDYFTARLTAGPTPPARPAVPPPRRKAGAFGRQPLWSKAMCLAAVQQFVAQQGWLPTGDQWRHAGAWGLPARQTVRVYWGGVQALETAVRAQLKTENKGT